MTYCGWSKVLSQRKSVWLREVQISRIHHSCNVTALAKTGMISWTGNWLWMLSKGRNVCLRWPRLTARLHSRDHLQVTGRLLSLRIWSTHLFRGRAVRRYHWLLGGLTNDIGWLGSWLSCESRRHLTAWPRDWRGHCDDNWWSQRWTGSGGRGDLVVQDELMPYFAATIFGTSIGDWPGSMQHLTTLFIIRCLVVRRFSLLAPP